MKLILATLIFFLSFSSIGQMNNECSAKKNFLIIKSTKDYKSALLTAQKAAKAFDIDIKLRGLEATNDTIIGLTMPPDSCKKYTSDNLCYIARGRWDDGIYISIEYSNAYDAFSKGYYIVIVGSGFPAGKNLIRTLKKVKIKYPDAYIKTSNVYICCMH